ncbi:hypothetical protein [Pseudolysinimonas sp.]|jgi:hypothetical protein|uniref:hypothetical protein n=1 Tax=Pseudolysinimonas sp. TaxID=2680009 RepID=UPI003785292F
MQVDPLLSLLVGALGAALLGLLGAWIQSRREDQRWIREQRLIAYTDFLSATRGFSVDVDGADDLKMPGDIREHLSRINLLGPDAVAGAAGSAVMAMREMVRWEEVTGGRPDPVEGKRLVKALRDHSRATLDFEIHARKALGIRRPTRSALVADMLEAMDSTRR